MSDEIFLSTQIQSRLDEIEQMEKERKGSVLLKKKYSHENVEVSKPMKSSTSPKRLVQKKKSKRQRKKPSVTEQMIMKLSGKPQKCRQMRLGVPEKPVVYFREYSGVFSADDWRRVRYSFKPSSSAISAPQSVETTPGETNFWSMANDAPVELQSDDWNELYERACSSERADCEPAITLSQCLRPLLHDQLHEIVEIENSEDDGSIIDISESIKIQRSTPQCNAWDEVPFYGDLSSFDPPYHSRHKIRVLHPICTVEELVCNSSDDEDHHMNIIKIERI
jgi:hypothetical protein